MTTTSDIALVPGKLFKFVLSPTSQILGVTFLKWMDVDETGDLQMIFPGDLILLLYRNNDHTCAYLTDSGKVCIGGDHQIRNFFEPYQLLEREEEENV